MIPDEAVEAALRALFPHDTEVRGFKRAVQEPSIRTILEAAAPFIAAEAWDEGAQAEADTIMLTEEEEVAGVHAATFVCPSRNPYRSQP